MELFAVFASFMSRSSASLKSLQVKWLQRDPLLPVACISYYYENSPKTSNDNTTFLSHKEGKGK